MGFVIRSSNRFQFSFFPSNFFSLCSSRSFNKLSFLSICDEKNSKHSIFAVDICCVVNVARCWTECMNCWSYSVQFCSISCEIFPIVLTLRIFQLCVLLCVCVFKSITLNASELKCFAYLNSDSQEKKNCEW